MLHKRSKLAAELAGMPGIQVYLVLGAVQTEPHGLIGGTASEIILQMHFEPLHYIPLSCELRSTADPQAT